MPCEEKLVEIRCGGGRLSTFTNGGRDAVQHTDIRRLLQSLLPRSEQGVPRRALYELHNLLSQLNRWYCASPEPDGLKRKCQRHRGPLTAAQAFMLLRAGSVTWTSTRTPGATHGRRWSGTPSRRRMCSRWEPPYPQSQSEDPAREVRGLLHPPFHSALHATPPTRHHPCSNDQATRSAAHAASRLRHYTPPPAVPVPQPVQRCSPPTPHLHTVTIALTLPSQELDLNQTLEENGVPDETPEFEDHNVPTDYYIPVLHVYWNDDLTVA